MRFVRSRRSVLFNFLLLIAMCSLLATPILAERPPDGYARPPIHVKPNATSAPRGLSPVQVRHAYGFDKIAAQGAAQTIAIVDAYDDPNIASDLNVFKRQFGLPDNACPFTKVYASGSRPRTDPGWALEIALDVEWACAIAPSANIVLVEAATNSFANLLAAVDYAAAHANVVSMSWGGGEFSSETFSTYDGHFNIPNVTFTASSGDSGNGVEYPAASPYVVAVGGTTLNVDALGNRLSETAWSGSGGGISVYEGILSYQGAVVPVDLDPNKRGVPDVAYDADPNTGFPVYDSVKSQGQWGWFQVGGTSAGAPQWAAFIAIVNSARTSPLSGTPAPIYAAYNATNFYDITSGTNGSCVDVCTARTGYDFVTGLGSPVADQLFQALIQ